MAKWPPGRAREHQPVVPGLREAAQMPAQLGSDHGGEVNHTATCRRLGWPEREMPRDLVQLPGDPDRASLQVDIAAAKRGQLAPAQTAENREPDQRFVTDRR